MKLVIDSNQLQSDILRRFLRASPSNIAVLTDYAAMEAYKGDTLSSIYKSMSLLCEYPSQVMVLRSTLVVCGLRGRRAGLQRRLVDEGQTIGFSKFADDLRRAQQGHARFEEALLKHGREATRHLNRMLDDAQTTGAAFAKVAAGYSKDERKAYRRGDVVSRELVDKTMKHVLRVAALALSEHPRVKARPTFEELPNTFIFRVSLCFYLLALDWAANGGAENASVEKLRNDVVDTNFAAYATYFDGLLSSDAKANRIHAEARMWLAALFDVESPSGWQGAKFA